MFKPFRSHRCLLGWSSGRVREDFHTFWRGFLPRDASMRALWPSKQNCSHNVFQKLKRIRCFSDPRGRATLKRGGPLQRNNALVRHSRVALANCREVVFLPSPSRRPLLGFSEIWRGKPTRQWHFFLLCFFRGFCDGNRPPFKERQPTQKSPPPPRHKIDFEEAVCADSFCLFFCLFSRNMGKVPHQFIQIVPK